MTSWAWNGTAFETRDSVPLTDRGFRYGMSLFESMRVQDGHVEFWDAHAHRLLAAAADRAFGSIDEPLLAARAHLESTGMDGFARIYITAGDGPPAGPAREPRVLLWIERRDPEASDCWSLRIHDEEYHAPFGGLKTANYWFNCDALAQARASGFDEALLFNNRAELVSACCANVFLVHDGMISTPSRGTGCRAGVVREWVIARRKVAERRMRHEDLMRADEIFVTNSWIGVMPIATIEGRPMGPRGTGIKLAAEFRALASATREQGQKNL